MKINTVKINSLFIMKNFSVKINSVFFLHRVMTFFVRVFLYIRNQDFDSERENG